jgi:hypothetical protein
VKIDRVCRPLSQETDDAEDTPAETQQPTP